MTLRYVPQSMLAKGADGHYRESPVAQIDATPGGPMLGGYTVTITLANGGTRRFGTATAYIDSTLRMVIDVNDHDEVRSKWELANRT